MPGRLFYLMGASGVGKDTLLTHIRAQLNPDDRILIAHRYITRVPASDENHVALTPAEFDLREQGQLFAFGWSSYGYRYAVGSEIDLWMGGGFDVVVNGSREALNPIRSTGRRLHPILVTASVATLRARLRQRGRDSASEIEARLSRHQALDLPDVLGDAQVITNNGTLEDTSTRLLEVLRVPREA